MDISQQKINGILKEKWHTLPDDEKDTWRAWCEWDKQRYSHESSIFDEAGKGGSVEAAKVPKKRKLSTEGPSVPKKKRS